MKKTLLLVATSLSFFCITCKKNNSTITTITKGIIAKKDNVQWVAPNSETYTGFNDLTTKDTLFILANIWNDHLYIAINQKGKGNYAQSQIKAFFYTTVGGDVQSDSYHLADVPSNSVVITEYDQINHVLKGTFNLTFKHSRGDYGVDTVKFTSGNINTELTNQRLNPFKGFQ